ncbi:Circadian clock-controlled protein daywake [Frankliniella fusca]|uniref:Circadian clock-controlled protein daywake n=1 Tax=Frankliniella fusca TaxID=407009 RepID=A0AAE1LAR2_9NEOP|nr:Circadian clock-controlled protein daywake [Frankliniella fusca]
MLYIRGAAATGGATGLPRAPRTFPAHDKMWWPLQHIARTALATAALLACAPSPALSSGDRARRIPRVDPLLVPVMPVSKHNGNALNMNLTFYNMHISDIARGVTAHSLKFDFDDLDLEIRFHRPHVNFNGTYRASGKVLWLPVWGSGPFTMKMSDVYERFHIRGVRKRGVDGRVYMHIREYTSTLEPRAMTLSFDNLFNGNWLLGKGANALINNEWKQIYGEIAPLTNQHFSIIMRPYWEDILSRDPIDVMFPPGTRYLYVVE